MEYIDRLHIVLTKASATDGCGKSVPLPKAVDRIARRITHAKDVRRKIVVIGNGGSCAMASHMATDLMKNAGISALSFSDASLLTCISNDLGCEFIFENPISKTMNKGDILVAISSSGKSMNILNGVEKARSLGCYLVTLSGFEGGNLLRRSGDINIYVPADSYGLVEVSHQVICHWITDIIVEKVNDGQV